MGLRRIRPHTCEAGGGTWQPPLQEQPQTPLVPVTKNGRLQCLPRTHLCWCSHRGFTSVCPFYVGVK